MSLAAWFKSRGADRVLGPLREEIIALVASGSRVYEVGCGTGDLLFRAADKIAYGLGVDQNQGMIKFADKRKEAEGIGNLEFLTADVQSVDFGEQQLFDVATSTLCLHELGENKSVEVLRSMLTLSNYVLIADFCEPKLLRSRMGMEIDEMLSGHYRRFCSYRRNGYLPGIVSKTKADVMEVITSSIDGICIWVLEGRSSKSA